MCTLHLMATLGELIDTIAAIFQSFSELFRAMWAILRLIGRLFGG
jgi:hypothetical protein